jgi:hypothetical protein
MLPFQTLIAENREFGMVVAVLIGFAFGFVLERAGFGDPKKLAAQFYLRDMTVFKVMFTGIITAGMGMGIAGGFGLIDLTALSEGAISFTYLWPMLVGGLALGAGFIISGYCPGTCVVASASGHVDGMITFGGVIVGSVIYGALFPLLSSFHYSGDKGHFFLYDLLGIPAPILAVIVAAAAVAMFLGAEIVERKFSAKWKGEPLTPARAGRSRTYAFGILAGLGLISLGTIAVPEAPEASPKRVIATISQADLAQRVIDEPWRLRILDLRDKKACAESRIPGSECAPLKTVGDLGLPYGSGVRDLVLVADKTAPVPAPAEAYPGAVLVLKDGFSGWKGYALTAPTLPESNAGAEAIEKYKFHASFHSAMTGRKPAPPPPASGTFVPKKKKKKGGGCS